MVTNIINAAIGSNASKKAASQEVAGANQAIGTQQQQYDTTRADLLANDARNVGNYSPYLQTGTAANQQLGYSLGLGGTGNGEAGAMAKPFTMADYQADPGYAFRLSEGQKALERTNAAKGKYFSGQAIKGLTDYNQNSASQEYQNAYDRFNTNQSNLYNRLAGLSTSGQQAAGGIATSGANTQSQLNNAGQNSANRIGGYQTGIGQSQSEGTTGSANAWTTGLSNIKQDVNDAAGTAMRFM